MVSLAQSNLPSEVIAIHTAYKFNIENGIKNSVGQ